MANSQEFTVGSIFTFMRRDTGERLKGMVYHINSKSQEPSFRIKNVLIWDANGNCRSGPGNFYFSLKEIMELQVLEGAIANTNQDGKNNNRDDGSSSKSTKGKM